MASRAASALSSFGAKPPSSPTAVLRPFFFSTDLSAWKISVMARRPSLKVSKPCGMTMNSWKSIGASEWAPPLMTLAMGTGSTLALGPPRYLKRGWPSVAAAALALASETARMALAPSLALVSVPSSSSMVLSTVSWSKASTPASAGAILSVTFLTALLTPLPR